jgi:hypothetical protein
MNELATMPQKPHSPLWQPLLAFSRAYKSDVDSAGRALPASRPGQVQLRLKQLDHLYP